METPRYKAFISYSHRDEAWARWLQRVLESYRVPKHLVGQQGSKGPIPARLRPVFRDREDLSSAADLSSQIKVELEHSENLVVICSPAAAASRWVAEEIRYFRQLGRSDRILALVVEGDPQSTAEGQACFPPALLGTGDGIQKEPLAADVRKYADGKHLALLKVVAGMLGLRLDELRRRDAQRQVRQRLAWSLAAILLVSVVGWLAYAEAKTRASAAAQRANTEELLGFMLGDLKRLAPIEGLEIVAADDEQQAVFRQQLGLATLDDSALIDQSLQWREAGLAAHRVGELQQAMRDFQQSRAAIIELHQREGNTPRALFELGQSEFYVGMVYWGMGELDKAQNSWVRYGAVTRRLVNAEPNNAAYVMELSYTLMNLGALEQSRPDPDSSRSLQLIQASLQFNQLAVVLDPGNQLYRSERATSLAWLADAWLEKCELGNAYESRQQSVDLRRELVAEHPQDAEQRRELAYMLSGLAGVQLQMGRNEDATASFRESVQLLAGLHRNEPDNAELEWQYRYRQQRLARHLYATGNPDQAWESTSQSAERMEWLSAPERNSDHLQAVEASLFRLDYARMMLSRGAAEQGGELLRRVNADLAELVRIKPGIRESLAALSYAYFEYWEHFGQAVPNGTGTLLESYLSRPEKVESCPDANQAARLAVIEGNPELARRYTAYALGKGYFEADFVAFCKAYQLCDLP